MCKCFRVNSFGGNWKAVATRQTHVIVVVLLKTEALHRMERGKKRPRGNEEMEEVRSSGRLKSSCSSYCFDTRIYQSVTFHCLAFIPVNMRWRKYRWHSATQSVEERWTDGWIAQEADGQIRKWKTMQRKAADRDVFIRVLWMEYDCSGVRKERYPVHTHTLCFLTPPDIIIWSRRWWCHRLWSRKCFICSRAHIYFSLSLSDCFIAPSHQGKLTEDKMGGWRQEVQLLGASHKHTAAALVSTPLRFITVSSMTSPTSPNDPGSDHLLVSLNCLAWTHKWTNFSCAPNWINCLNYPP